MAYKLFITGVGQPGGMAEQVYMLNPDGSQDTSFLYLNGLDMSNVNTVQTARAEYIGNDEILCSGMMVTDGGSTMYQMWVIDSSGVYKRRATGLGPSGSPNMFKVSDDKRFAYMIGVSNVLYKVNLETMVVEWTYSNPDLYSYSGIYTPAGDKVFVVLSNGTTVVLDDANGVVTNPAFTFPFSYNQITEMRTAGNRIYVYTTSTIALNTLNDIKCISLDGTQTIWEHSTDYYLSSVVGAGDDVFAVSNGLVYFKFLDNHHIFPNPTAPGGSIWRVGRLIAETGKVDMSFCFNVDFPFGNEDQAGRLSSISVTPNNNIAVINGILRLTDWNGAAQGGFSSPIGLFQTANEVTAVPLSEPLTIFGARFIVEDSSGNIGFADKTASEIE